MGEEGDVRERFGDQGGLRADWIKTEFERQENPDMTSISMDLYN